MAQPSSGVGSPAPRRDFPPRWVGGVIKATILVIHYAFWAAAGTATYAAGVELRRLHQSDRLLPPLLTFLQTTHSLPGWQLAGSCCCAAAAAAVLLALFKRQRGGKPIYLLDFECYRPEPHLMVSYDKFVNHSRRSGFFDEESMDFQTRILHKSGLSQETFFPPGLHLEPPEFDMGRAREEAEIVMFNSVADVLAKAGLTARQIDVLVVNCSLFGPTPSLSAMIVHRFGMRSDIDSYNLGGMGCSAGMIAIDLAAKMLRERRSGGYALVVSTESITQNWYRSNERSMLIPNTIFRMGAAAILLTSKPSEKRRSRYELQHVVRVHMGAEDDAYRCVFQRPDGASPPCIGVELSKDLVSVAGRAMEKNMTRLGPLVLPWHEKLMFAANWVARRILRLRVPRYIPDFRTAFDHFCLHAGGRGVVEGLSKQLGLTPEQMAPSANTLHWYGNTSSSTVWYSFGFVESVQGVKAGDVVWQIGFGSGFKCNSVVWRALRDVKTVHRAWEHVQGREGQALEVLARIAAETAAERRQKAEQAEAAAAAAGGKAGGKAAGNGSISAAAAAVAAASPANGNRNRVKATATTATGLNGGAEGEDPGTEAAAEKQSGGNVVRALRSGRTYAAAHN